MKNCEINKRMKDFYESRSKTHLTRRTPVVIRLDGKSFHTYTKGLDKPFDEGLIEDMQETAKFLCSEIQGAKVAYTQSDEISILITDYDKLTTDAWFDYSVQKMCSVSASLATAKFNRLRMSRYFDELHKAENFNELNQIGKVLPFAFFDARAFNIPKEEVSNYFLARQKDAIKNSIAMLAQSLYSHKELHKKNGDQMQEMCFQKGKNWNDLSVSKKRGSTVLKNTYINGINLSTQKEGLGELLYQPKLKSTNYPDKRGRLLEWTVVKDLHVNDFGDPIDGEAFCETPIKTVRTKWESVETPSKFDESFFKEFL